MPEVASVLEFDTQTEGLGTLGSRPRTFSKRPMEKTSSGNCANVLFSDLFVGYNDFRMNI